MPSVLALISKAVFAKLPPIRDVGEVVPLDRYTSKHAAFDALGPGDSLYLVTVRPTGPLLVAIIDSPKRKGDALVGAINTTGCRFITNELRRVRLADGKGITATLDKLGMSLQTPRVLAEGDGALLRVAASPAKTKTPAQAVVRMKVGTKKQAVLRMKVERRKKTDAGAPKLKGGKLSARAQELVDAVYERPDDRARRGVLADQLLEDQHVWGELISLQLSNPKKHAARIDALIKQHAREFVGDIANVAARGDLEIVDGFLVSARCGKSKSFTSAAQRSLAAKASQWATVETLILTPEMTSVFLAELLSNPASASLRTIDYGGVGQRRTAMASRATSTGPWHLDARCKTFRARMLFDALSEQELQRLVVPNSGDLRVEFEKARTRRARARTRG